MKIKSLYIQFIALCVITVMLTSCNIGKSAQGTKPLKKRSSQYLLKKMKANKKTPNWFSTKALINYKDDNQSVKITSYIRIRKDSVIWMNIKKFGVEAARVQITPDSIYLLDRLNKTYTVSSFDFLSRQFRLPEGLANTLNYKAVENIFLGNPVFIPMSKMETNVEPDAQYKLYGDYDNVEGNYYIDGDYELRQMAFDDIRADQSVSFNYSSYEEVKKKGVFSLFRTIDLSSEDLGDLRMTIDLSKLEIDIPKKLKFDIPQTYTKAQ